MAVEIAKYEQRLFQKERNTYDRFLSSLNFDIGGIRIAPGGTGKSSLIEILQANHLSSTTFWQSSKTSTYFLGGWIQWYMEAELRYCKPTHSTIGLRQLGKSGVQHKPQLGERGNFEPLVQTVQHRRHSKRVMVAVTVVMACDFWQTLPLISRGTRADEVGVCINYFYMWQPLHDNTRESSTRWRQSLGYFDNALSECR